MSKEERTTGRDSDRIGLYPGTFDPVTNGHLDIIERAAAIVDHLIIAVAISEGKGPMFSLTERTEMLQNAIDDLVAKRPTTSIEVVPFDKLLVNVAEEVGANLFIKGIRNMTDFEYEYQMIGMNAKLSPDLDTVFLISKAENQSIASRLVKEIATLDGEISHFVPKDVENRLMKKLGRS